MGQQKLGFIGGGVMAEVILKGIIEKKIFTPEQIWVFDINNTKAENLQLEYNINIASDNNSLVQTADVIILAVKPQVTENVLCQINTGDWKGKLLISIVAGIDLLSLRVWSADNLSIVRIMPNTPCMVGEGMSAICFDKNAKEEEKKLVEEIFTSVGKICLIEEQLMNAVTGVSGSGPAYGYMIIEALSDGGVREGLPRTVSLQLAAQTMLGAAAMVLKTGKHPGELKDMVTSPGGTSIEALTSLEKSGIRAALIKAVEVATKKAAKLGNNKITLIGGDD